VARGSAVPAGDGARCPVRRRAHEGGPGGAATATPPDHPAAGRGAGPAERPRRASPSAALRERLAARRGAVAVVLLLELGARAVGLVQPLAAREVVDGVGAAGGPGGPIAVLGALAAVGLVLNYLAYDQRGRLSEKLVLDLRRTAARRVVLAPVPAVASRPVGDVLSRIGSDTTLVQQTVVKALVDLVVVPLTAVVGIVLMLFVDVFLASLVLGLLAVAAVVELGVFRRLARDTERGQQHVGAMTGVVHRVLLALRTVKASSMEHREAESFDREAGSAYRAGLRVARTGAWADTVAYASVDLTFLTVLAVGVLRVGSGAVGVGDLVAILLYLVYIQDPVESLTESASRLSEGVAALRRITGLLDLPAEAEVAARRPGRAPGARAGARDRLLRLDHVSFGHGDREVLRDVTIEARPGLTVLVGPSGTGKTTVLSLVERFVDPDRGRVLLDGQDVRDLDLAHLRRRVSYVEQEAPLLGATIREAAGYGVDGLAEDGLRRVLASVGLAEWVRGLPRGLDTEVGERGVRISGGQRQRIAVARALARDSEVLLLDEATSQLDPLSEQTLVESIVRDHGDRIVLAVTHRLPLVLQADQVVLLHGGSVHASGAHEQLVHDPTYRKVLAFPAVDR